MGRLRHFIRSILPADRAQLLFLFGVVCLVISPRLRWWPPSLYAQHGVELQYVLAQLGVFFLWPIVFAGVAGYYVCFWPGTRPIRRISLLVFAPALVGMGLLFGRAYYLNEPPYSVLDTSHHGSFAIFLKLSGPHFGVLGLFLVALFLIRIAVGSTVLPLALSQKADLAVDDSRAWQRLLFVIWFLIGPLFLCSALIGLFASFAMALRVGSLQLSWFQPLSVTAGTGLALGITLILMGKDEWHALRRTLTWPGEKYLLLAFSFPIASALVFPLGEYVYDRTQWAIYAFGQLDAPEFASYFEHPNPWLLLLFFPALFEELIFRGLLQPKFVQRYGLYRGIVLVGLVWSAFHFFSDFSFSHTSDLGALEQLLFRVFLCVTHSFVFGWLMLQSGSVFPPAIAHALYNISVELHFGEPFFGREVVRVSVWAIIALLLFRYWPPESREPVQEPPGEETAPSPTA